MPTCYGDVYVNSLGAFLPGPSGCQRRDRPLHRAAQPMSEPHQAGASWPRTASASWLLRDRRRRPHCTAITRAQLAAGARPPLPREGRRPSSRRRLRWLASGSLGWRYADSAGLRQHDPGRARAAPPMETLSCMHGICAAGVSAIQAAGPGLVEMGAHRSGPGGGPAKSRRACSSARASRPGGYDADFDSHFLRWMLSEARARLLLGDRPARAELACR